MDFKKQQEEHKERSKRTLSKTSRRQQEVYCDGVEEEGEKEVVPLEESSQRKPSREKLSPGLCADEAIVVPTQLTSLEK